MCKLHTIENSFLNLSISEVGGAITTFKYLPREFDILRPSNNIDYAGSSGLFPMIPMANRIKENKFHWLGKTVHLPFNFYDKKYFLHGDGWLNRWRRDVTQESLGQVLLYSSSTIPDVCQYDATLKFSLSDSCLKLTLMVCNQGEFSFPFGAGFHPFFNTTSETKVKFDAEGVWLEDLEHLPTDYLTEIPSWLDFNKIKVIPDEWINNGYRILPTNKIEIHHSNGIQVIVETSCEYLQVFKPDKESNYICLEPQSHFINAHNHSQYESLAVLKPGQSMMINMSIAIFN